MTIVPLPIDSHLAEIVGGLRASNSLVVVAEPGAGKTTRVPPAILRLNILGGEHPNLIMLQPRRVAARAAAQRIADENRWPLGGTEIGYQIRFEKRLTDQTRIRILTEGILTRQLLADPFLEGVGLVILDEFHERSVHIDLAIAMLRELQQTVRPDLKIIVMSATLQAEPAAKFLGNCPIIRVPGRMFPVEIEHRPHASLKLIPRAVAAIEDVLGHAESAGDILVFLPGAEEIRRVQRELGAHDDLAILPLHGSLPPGEQFRALEPSSRRKVVLATNIAETSLTIDGVRWVIDTGLARVPEFDPRRGIDRLELKQISKASATQRAGRAGRTAPGRCVRLWSAKEQAALEDFELPEIKRVDLCSAVLDLHAWGKPKPGEFGWFEAPPAESLVAAQSLLELLGAFDPKVGKILTRLPLHPRLGRLLVAAAEAGYVEEGAALAALLSEKDVRRPDYSQPRHLRGPATQSDSDLLLRLDDLNSHRRDEAIDPITLRQVEKVRDELSRLAHRMHAAKAREPSREMLLKLPLYAYPDRVCRRRANDSAAGLMTGGSGVRLDPESIVRRGEFFLALDAWHDPRSPTSEAQVRVASAIEVQWLHELFPQFITREKKVEFDESRQRVKASIITRYRDLVIAEEANVAVNAEDASRVFIDSIRPQAESIFAADESASQVLARVAFLRRHMPEHPWPVFDAKTLGDILEENGAGKKSVEEMKRQDLAGALESRLPYPLNDLLRQHAPVAMEVPTGNRIRLEYRAGGEAPILAVRLQEVFSWTDTPRIAGGRVAVLLHLLGPNYRPVQITSDLKSFWKTTYFQVRKDLRVRYPKHSWPEDPLTALPVAKGSRRSARK
jgi:ATP-dependent helicase HrpB